MVAGYYCVNSCWLLLCQLCCCISQIAAHPNMDCKSSSAPSNTSFKSQYYKLQHTAHCSNKHFLTHTSVFSRSGNLICHLGCPLPTPFYSLDSPRQHVFLLPLFLIFALATQKEASISEEVVHCSRLSVHGCFQLSLPTPGAGPKFCAKQTSPCFPSKSTTTEADSSKAEWMHSMFTSVSWTALAINQCWTTRTIGATRSATDLIFWLHLPTHFLFKSKALSSCFVALTAMIQISVK